MSKHEFRDCIDHRLMIMAQKVVENKKIDLRGIILLSQ